MEAETPTRSPWLTWLSRKSLWTILVQVSSRESWMYNLELIWNKSRLEMLNCGSILYHRCPRWDCGAGRKCAPGRWVSASLLKTFPITAITFFFNPRFSLEDRFIYFKNVDL